MNDEKVALITAGGSGMGADAARRLSDDGFRVAILSSSGRGEALAAELDGVGVTGSNRSADDLGTLVDTALERWGRIHYGSEHSNRRRADPFRVAVRQRSADERPR